MNGRHLQRLSAQGLFAVILAVLAVFLIWPIILTAYKGFVDADGRFTLDYLVSIFQDPVQVRALGNSVLVAVFTTLICLVISVPLAILSVRYTFRGKGLLNALVLVPLILPPFVGAIGMRAILGRFGALNSLLQSVGILDPNEPGIDFLGGAVGGRFLGVVLMEALHLYPILYLNVSAALANLDPALDEAAQNLGASPWRRFFKVTLPLILPGIFAGGTIVFIWSFTELGTPLMFDYYAVTPVQVFYGIQEMQNNPRPYALVVVMLGAAVVMYLIGKLTLGRRGYEMQGKASIASTTKPLGPLASFGAVALFGGVTLLAVLPHLGVVISSFTVDGAWYRSVLPTRWTGGHYPAVLSESLAIDSIRNSLLYASLATAVCVVVGLTISYLNVRVRVVGGWLLDSLAMLPLAVPGLVMAFGYVAMSLSWPFRMGDIVPGFGFEVLGRDPNPVPLLIIAYAIRRLPYVVRSASAGLEQTSRSMEEAAYNLGASTTTTMRRIVVPLIMANLIAGAILAFSFAMLEVSDSLILAQKEEHYPITKAIYTFFGQRGNGPYIASAMGVWGMALLTTTLVGASVMMGKRLGAIFRV